MALVKRSSKLCKQCIYHTRISITEKMSSKTRCVGCYYSVIARHSRIFKDGKLAYDPEYCDKFVAGKPIKKAGESDGEQP